MITNPVIDCLNNHVSIRKYKKKEISKEIIDSLLTAGTRAANGGNLQRYSLIVVNEKDKMKEIMEYDKFNNLNDVPLMIISCIDNYRMKKWFDVNEAKYSMVDGPIDFLLAFYDAVLALQNICIAAESLGLGAYYNGNVLTFDIKKLFNAPDYTFPVGMLCIGYPDDKEPWRLDRLPIEAVVHYNTYKLPDEDDINEWFREKEERFRKYNTKERLEYLESQGVYNLAQGYCYSKFSQPDKTIERSKKVLNNIKQSKFMFNEIYTVQKND